MVSSYLNKLYYDNNVYLAMHEYFPGGVQLNFALSEVKNMLDNFHAFYQNISQFISVIADVGMLYWVASGIKVPSLGFLCVSNPLATAVVLITIIGLAASTILCQQILKIQNEISELKVELSKISIPTQSRDSAIIIASANIGEEMNKKAASLLAEQNMKEGQLNWYGTLQTLVAGTFFTLNLVLVLWAMSPMVAAGVYTYVAHCLPVLAATRTLNTSVITGMEAIVSSGDFYSNFKNVKQFTDNAQKCTKRYKDRKIQHISLQSQEGGSQVLARVRLTSLETAKHVGLLNAVSFDIPSSKFIRLKGVSGSGKSTMIKAIFGMHNEVTGCVAIIDKKIFIPQSTSLSFEDCSLNDLFKKFGLESITDNNDVVYLIKRLELHEKIKNINSEVEFSSFSGGESKRLMVLIALSSKSKIIVLDEITAGLDEAKIAIIEKEFFDYTRQGNSVLHIDHHETLKAKDAYYDQLINVQGKDKVVEVYETTAKDQHYCLLNQPITDSIGKILIN